MSANTNPRVRWKRLGALLALAAFSWLAAGCASTDESLYSLKPIHDFKRAPLIGVIYTSRNQPCPDAVVTLTIPLEDEGAEAPSLEEREEGESGAAEVEVRTDINGRFIIPRVTRGRHRIRIRKEGYEEGEILFDFLDMTKVFYVQLISLEFLLDEAEGFLEKRELHKAQNRLTRALVVDDRSVEALYLQAVHAALSEDPESARQVLARIAEIDPDFPAPLPTD